MAILDRTKIRPQQRLDLEDWDALLSGLRTDSKFWTKQVFCSTNKIVSGFAVSGIGATSATIAMTGATLVNPENTTDFSYYTASTGEPDITVTAAELTNSTRNYIELTLATEENTQASKAFWDPDADAGAGQEFNEIVNTITSLKVSVNVTTSGFTAGGDAIPLAILEVNGSGIIKVILDRRELLGRLAIPTDLTNDYAWGTKEEPIYTMALTGSAGTFTTGDVITIGTDTATVVTGGVAPASITFNSPSGTSFGNGDAVTGGGTGTVDTIVESFTGVDKSIDTIEAALKALMTEIKSIKGLPYWWTDSTVDLEDLVTLIPRNDQDRTATLVGGGTWSVVDNAGTLELRNSALAYIQVPGLTQARNRIAIQTISLPNATSIAYVDLNRDTGTASSRTVTVVNDSAYVAGNDRVVIARRTTEGVLVGFPATFMIADGEFLTLAGALQELNKYMGMLRIEPHESDGQNLRITTSEITKLSGSALNQQISNLLLDFEGAVIEIDTGNVFKSDGSTALGVNFTPPTVAASQYRWLGFTLISTSNNANNTAIGTISVSIGSADGASADAAVRAEFGEGIPIGQVYIQRNAGNTAFEDLDYANIVQLGAGSGSQLANVEKRQLFTSSGTFTVPAGVDNIFVTATAPGGGGGSGEGGAANAGSGGGGGAGGFIIKMPVDVSSASSITMTIGTAGTGGAVAAGAGNDGTDGGNTVIGNGADTLGVIETLTGGAKGLGGASTLGGAGGANGTVTNRSEIGGDTDGATGNNGSGGGTGDDGVLGGYNHIAYPGAVGLGTADDGGDASVGSYGSGGSSGAGAQGGSDNGGAGADGGAGYILVEW